MKFFGALLVWLIMAIVFTVGIVMAVGGKAWLLVLAGVAFVFLFSKYGCLESH